MQSQTGRSPPQAHQTPSPTTFPGPPSPLPAAPPPTGSVPPSILPRGRPTRATRNRASRGAMAGARGQSGPGSGQRPALESTQAGLGGTAGAGQPPALRSCWSASGTAALHKGDKDGRLVGSQLSRCQGRPPGGGVAGGEEQGWDLCRREGVGRGGRRRGLNARPNPHATQGCPRRGRWSLERPLPTQALGAG